MKKLRVAVIGCGGMARFYCRRYTQIPHAELALLVDTNRSLAESIAQPLGGVAVSDRFEDALAPDIDVVDISTPNFLHASQAIAAIRSGKHVLLQKPLAPSLEEGMAILEEARRSDRTVGMYMSTFNDPLMLDLKRLIQEGLLGHIEGVHCRNAHKGGLTMAPGTWRSKEEQCGGGAFIQLAIHAVDAVQWLLDSPIESVMAYSQNLACPHVGGDDATAAGCRFGNGVLGTLEASYCADRKFLNVYGSKGYFVLRGDESLEVCLETPFEGDCLHYTTPGKKLQLPLKTTLQWYEEENPHDQSIAFVEAVLQGKPAPVSVERGLYDLKVVKAIYASALSGRRERVDVPSIVTEK